MIDFSAVFLTNILASALLRIEQVFSSLLQEEDTDHDNKITIDDFPIKQSQKGDKEFIVIDIHNQQYEINGTYYLSNLLQELSLHKNMGQKIATISTDRIFEKPGILKTPLT